MAKARVLMRQFEKRINDEAHQLMVTFWYPRRAHAVLREGLEDLAEPLPEPGPGQRLARQVMLRYVIKRVLLVIPTLLGAAALVFVLMRLIPGDVCVVRLGSSGGTFDPKAIALCHAELGMDRPVLIQFIDFVWGCMRLDFGTSMWSGQPVTTEIMARLPISLEIAILATRRRHRHRHPARRDIGRQAEHLDRLCGARLRRRRHRHAVVLAGDHVDPGRPQLHQRRVRQALDAADRVRAHLGGPDPQPEHGVPAGRHGRIPLCRGQHAHDALGDAGGDAGGLHPHRPREGADQEADRQPPCAEERACCRW